MTRALALVLLLTACGPFPQVETATPVAGMTPPALLPADQLAASTGTLTGQDPLAARSAALRARADALRASQ